MHGAPVAKCGLERTVPHEGIRPFAGAVQVVGSEPSFTGRNRGRLTLYPVSFSARIRLAEREYCVCGKSLPDQRRISQIPLRESAWESPRLFRKVQLESGGFLSGSSVVVIGGMSWYLSSDFVAGRFNVRNTSQSKKGPRTPSATRAAGNLARGLRGLPELFAGGVRFVSNSPGSVPSGGRLAQST